MGLAIDIADAVVAELAKGTFSQAFAPVRRVLPSYELKDLSVLRVTVAPAAVEMEAASRSLTQHDFQIDVGIQKHLGSDVDAEVAGLTDLVDELADYLRRRRLEAAPEAMWVRTANAPIYSPEHLSEERTFTSILTLTYRVMK